MSIFAIGMNHRSAPVAVRELWSFTADTATDLAMQAIQDKVVEEALVISTCNRTEIYGTGTSPEVLLAWLAQYKRSGSSDVDMQHFYKYANLEATQHLMRVATGIDSMILGESQILGQIKQAFKQAVAAGTVGKNLQQLLQHTFAVAKTVRANTNIGSYPVSVAYAAVKLFERIFSDVSTVRVLLLGAGDMMTLTGKHLQQAGVRSFVVCNRTYNAACKLAEKFQAKTIKLDQLAEYLPNVDIVISATASTTPLINKKMVQYALKLRKFKPMSMIDLSVPRDIAPQVAELADVYLYSIDDLENVVATNTIARYDAAHQAQSIINVAAEKFMTWLKAQQHVDLLRDFRGGNAVICANSVQQALKQLRAGKDPEVVVADLAGSLTNKLMHQPTMLLRNVIFNKSESN
ncbi:MAG: glutamyl-tRNA reductase [Thiotrichales bacterium]|nr:MAG: glutamyl-tRNA reductase [Thiotrichales bacterium]